MKVFSGFPRGKARTVSLPEPVFTELLPLIDDLAELKVTLYVLWRLGRQRGDVRFVRGADLASDQPLLSGLGDVPQETLKAALARAVERGTLLQAQAPEEEGEGALYFANSPKGRAAAEAIDRGEWPQEARPADRPNVFTLYEQNIGLVTPLIADELREAEEAYPPEWIEDAFREAVSLNKRSWKYIRAILERWRAEGREDETARRHREGDRRRYIEGEYGEYIEH